MTNKEKAKLDYAAEVERWNSRDRGNQSGFEIGSHTTYGTPVMRQASGPVSMPPQWEWGLNDTLVLKNDYKSPTFIRLEFGGDAPREFVREQLKCLLNNLQLDHASMEHQRRWEEAEYVENLT